MIANPTADDHKGAGHRHRFRSNVRTGRGSQRSRRSTARSGKCMQDAMIGISSRRDAYEQTVSG
jgi:hypothetical protein